MAKAGLDGLHRLAVPDEQGRVVVPETVEGPSMGRVASSVDNGLVESFWSTMQRELFDRQTWDTQADLGSAVFEWIEAFCNPRRRHSTLGYLSPAQFEHLHTAALTAHDHHTRCVRRTGSGSL